MNYKSKKSNYLLHLLIIALLAIYLLNIYYPWSLGLLAAFFLVASIYVFSLLFSPRDNGRKDFVEEVISYLPSILLVIDIKGNLLWHSPKFREICKNDEDEKSNISYLVPGVKFKKNSDFSRLSTDQVIIKSRVYRVKILPYTPELRLLSLEDITGEGFSQEKEQWDRPVIGIIQIDNYFEVMESLEEERPLILAEIDRIISDWAIERDGYIKKYTEDKYLIFLTNRGLRYGEEDRFVLLDKVRTLDYGKAPLTLSIGFGIQEEALVDLGRLAQLALELALGRGGDQVVVKSPEQVWFYGGMSKALEKRTKVKARVIAHSLRDMILASQKVFIMGHEGADYDSIGASLGLAAAVKNLNGEPYIIIDSINTSFAKLLSIVDNTKMPGKLIYPGEGRIDSHQASLLIVVDTHKPSLVVDKPLLEKATDIVVIDHHRRAEEFIENASLTYIEPYASSTSELITELIQYLGDEIEIGSLEATALLAGITVDTKNFIFQTGVRTFDAASYLRRIGADPVMVQKLLRDEYDQVRKKALIIKNSQIMKEKIAIGTYPEATEEPHILAAQGADELLNINGVEGAFVICPTHGGGVVISARSTGDINVQVLMEKLGGGGHLTIAAAQLKDTLLAEAQEQIITLIEENY